MTLREPNTLPARFSSWDDWRESYTEYRAMYLRREIDRVRLRAYFVMLGFAGHDLEAELNDALENRGKA